MLTEVGLVTLAMIEQAANNCRHVFDQETAEAWQKCLKAKEEAAEAERRAAEAKREAAKAKREAAKAKQMLLNAVISMLAADMRRDEILSALGVDVTWLKEFFSNAEQVS